MEPSAATLTALACLGTSAALLVFRARWTQVLGQLLACSAAAIAIGAAIARLLEGIGARDMAAGSGPGLVAIFALLVLSIALTVPRRDLPPASWYLRTGGGEDAARRVLPPALTGPPAFAILFEAGIAWGWWSELTALTLFTVSMVALICSLIVAGVDAVRSFDERRAAAEKAQAAERRRVEALTQRSPVGIFETDAQGHMLYLNERLGEMSGIAPGAADDVAIAGAVHPDDLEVVATAWFQAVTTGGDFDVDYRYLRPDGSVCWAIGHASPISDGEGGVAGYLGTVQDVTELRQREAALREAEERFRHAFEHALIGVALVSPEGEWLRVNRRMCTMTGYREDELLGMSFQEITHPDDLELDLAESTQLLAGEIDGYEMQKRYLRADGEPIWVQLSVSLVRGDDEEPLYFVSQVQDVTERRREESKLRKMADTDPLTGLANRRRFADDLAREVAKSGRDGSDLALLLLDIDGFKLINDTLGHRAGDDLLRRVAETLTLRTRKTDIAGRLGGDEFAVLLPGADRAAARAAADGVLNSIRAEAFQFEDVEVRASVSIGVVMARDVDDPAVTLLAGADKAMYAAKAAGRGRVAELGRGAAARLSG